MFNLEYLAANVGSDIEIGGDVFKDEELVANDDGEITLSLTAVPIRSNSTVAYAYVREATNGGAKRSAILVSEDNKLTGMTPGVKYCVRYMYTDDNSRRLVINSNFIPGTFSVVLTATLYSGDACNVTNTGTAVGQLTIKVPRFQLNGSQELSMSASGISNTSFEGSALASGCTGCNDNGVYAEIIETIFNALWYDNYTGLMFEDEDAEMTVGGTLPETVVYAIPSSGSPLKVDNTIITQKETGVDAANKTQLVFSISAGTTGLSVDASTGALSGTAAVGTATVKVVLMNTATNQPVPGFSAEKTITVSAT